MRGSVEGHIVCEPVDSKARSIVRGQHLTLGYPHRVVVRDLSFEIHRGDILGIVGPNGCGKTTLLRSVLGLTLPLQGSVERDPALVVSYVPQRDRLDTMLPITALEVVLMGRTARAGVVRRSPPAIAPPPRARWLRSTPTLSLRSYSAIFQAASSSASSLPGRSRPSPMYSSSTNRQPGWTSPPKRPLSRCSEI